MPNAIGTVSNEATASTFTFHEKRKKVPALYRKKGMRMITDVCLVAKARPMKSQDERGEPVNPGSLCLTADDIARVQNKIAYVSVLASEHQ